MRLFSVLVLLAGVHFVLAQQLTAQASQSTASDQVNLELDAKKMIDAWMKPFFVQFRGSTYVVQKTERGGGMQIGSILGAVVPYGWGDDGFYYNGLVELTGFAGWRIVKESIPQPSPAERMNGIKPDEWIGRAELVSNGPRISRRFSLASRGWPENSYRDFWGLEKDNLLPTQFRFIKRNGSWIFELSEKLLRPDPTIVEASFSDHFKSHLKYNLSTNGQELIDFLYHGDPEKKAGTIVASNPTGRKVRLQIFSPLLTKVFDGDISSGITMIKDSAGKNIVVGGSLWSFKFDSGVRCYFRDSSVMWNYASKQFVIDPSNRCGL